MSANLQALPIPLVDIAPLTSGNTEEAAKTAASLFDAFTEYGFAYIKNHGLPQKTIDEAFQWVAIFPLMSFDVRANYKGGRAQSSSRSHKTTRKRHLTLLLAGGIEDTLE